LKSYDIRNVYFTVYAHINEIDGRHSLPIEYI